MGPITFLRRQRKAVSSDLLIVRWTSNSASIIRHIFLFLFAPMCLDMFHLHQDASFTSSCSSSQILIHKSASSALGLMHSFFPFCNPSIIPLLSTCTQTGPITLDIRPANIEELFLRPTFPSKKDLPALIAMLFAPFLPHSLSQESWTWFERCSFVQLFIFVLCCPLLPAHRSGLCTSIFLTSF